MNLANKVLNFLLLVVFNAGAQDTVHYTGTTLSNVDYHSGHLPLAMGVHNMQVLRANRTDTSAKAGYGWTYNHAPMLAYWNNRFYLEYLSNPVGEHVPPGQTLLATSTDGYHWGTPTVVFPPYKIPDGTVKLGHTDSSKNTFAVMHQRIGFFTAKNKKLLALAYYGMVLAPKDDPNDGLGIGRVVREINLDGSFGPIFFLRYNHGFNDKNTSYPFYKSSSAVAFVAACDELLASPLQMQQMVEEADRDDQLIPLKKDFKAFNYYHLSDGRVVGLWKYALASISKEEGKTWVYSPTRAPGFVNSNAKIWGQKTSDGKYATVYNPSEFRWPLAISVSGDGLNYTDLLLVNGEITTMRYGGAYKSYGPQYVRGIQEIDGSPPGGNMWVTYSMNKEDIWVSSIAIPVNDKATEPVNDFFSKIKEGEELRLWNLYSPLWSQVTIDKLADGNKVLSLKDRDPFDFAKAERLFPVSKNIEINFTVCPQQNNRGLLAIELADAKGTPCLRLMLDSTGNILTKQGYRNKSLGKYLGGEKLSFKIELNTTTRFYSVSINGGKASSNLCFAPVESVERIVFKTGDTRHFPDADTPTDQNYDLPNASRIDEEAIFNIYNLQTTNL